MAKRSYWPPPVYVASFADGTECRMSIWSQEGKPLDFERGRKVCRGVIGDERAHRAVREGDPVLQRDAPWMRGHSWNAKTDVRWHPDNPALRYAKPADDLTAGYFEHDGLRVPDPYFEPAAALQPKRKVSALDRVLAAVRKLSAEDLIQLSEAVDAAFDAAE